MARMTRRTHITRDTQRTDTIYVEPDGGAFFTPDGEGRIWYDTRQAAQGDTGIDAIVLLTETTED